MSIPPIARSSRCLNSLPTQFSHRLSQQRLLSTSASLQAVKPESPRYVEVPKTQQAPVYPPPAPLKGVLPTPKEILPRRRQYKATPKWLAKATPEPSRPSSTDNERVAYKDRMAEMRRTNLRQGITELYDRTIETEYSQDTREEHETLSKLKALGAPEGHDEVWTKPSVSKAIRDALRKNRTQPVITPDMEPKKKETHERLLKAEEEERLQHLHSLYLHARNFITTTDQLAEEIEKVFGDDDNPIMWNYNPSVWALGKPLNSSEMMGLAPDISNESPDPLAVEKLNREMSVRMMRIAGQLTGGKIPIPDKLAKAKIEDVYSMRDT
ncbi:hypothetical protein BT63DRAFT_85412 [Microthyrium microscopicum]|uniref:Uncharacterized protein n=1 Tax=Microthyrium microscopicum TaxID=703497 RepID=A0A6A6U0I9_9PEZI|nr:hypothetical protein BT63DRAFT_85412 [Microthyrium microscopicum]